MLGHSIHVVISLWFLASMAYFSTFEVIVTTLAAFPATWWELTLLLLLLGFKLIAHAVFASIARFPSLEIVVQALVAVPATFWELKRLLVHLIGHLRHLLGLESLHLWLKGVSVQIELRV